MVIWKTQIKLYIPSVEPEAPYPLELPAIMNHWPTIIYFSFSGPDLVNLVLEWIDSMADSSTYPANISSGYRS